MQIGNNCKTTDERNRYEAGDYNVFTVLLVQKALYG